MPGHAHELLLASVRLLMRMLAFFIIIVIISCRDVSFLIESKPRPNQVGFIQVDRTGLTILTKFVSGRRIRVDWFGPVWFTRFKCTPDPIGFMGQVLVHVPRHM